MAVVLDKLVEPAYSDYRKVRPHSMVAVGVGLVGLMIAMAVLAISISAADALNSGGLDTAKFLALGFGLQTLALVTLKFGIKVKTLKMPATAKWFILLMAMGMMIIPAAVVAHVVVGQAITDGRWTPSKIEQWTIWLEAARRIGVVIYLFAITLGLITIATVIRYQTFRIREIAASRTSG